MPANGNTNQLGDGLNTIGYSFNARANRTRDSVTGKADYYLTQSHTFSASYVWNRENVDRPDAGNFFTTTPPVSNQNTAALAAVSWRWIARPTLTNEARGGFNRTTGPFSVSNPVPQFVLTGLSFTSPINAKLLLTIRKMRSISSSCDVTENARRPSFSISAVTGLMKLGSVTRNSTAR